MLHSSHRRLAKFLPAIGLGLLCGGSACGQLPDSLDDRAYWELVRSLSEPEGRFPPQYMSNEDSLQYVMPELIARGETGGVYIGVGSEQNFTYMAVLEPELAFIVDIRRDNLRQVLLYKALFELSADRVSFISRLFSRPLVEDFEADGGAEALFAAYAGQTADPSIFDATREEVFTNLIVLHGFTLDAEDREGIVAMLEVFRDSGPEQLKGFGDLTNPTFAQLMAATDLEGTARGFLNSESNYATNRTLHLRNLIIPVVGDFAGDSALAGIGRFLTEHEAAVQVFYVSNVERYLWEQGEQGLNFYRNVALLPLEDSSLFIRSVTSDISMRLDIPIPDQPAKWRTFLAPIRDDLDGVAGGRIASYRDLFIP
jgi:hypothetical protein